MQPCARHAVAAPWPAAARDGAAPHPAAGRTVFVFSLDPVLDARAARRAARAFRNVPDDGHIVWLDCSAVRSVSAAGALLLARFAREAARRATLRILCVPDHVRPPLVTAGLRRFIWEPQLPALSSEPA